MRELRTAWTWQDPEVLLGVLSPAGRRVLVIGDPGDGALSLAVSGAEVVVVPEDAAQAALLAVKLAAARELPVQSVRSFLGLGHFGRRVWFYHYLRPKLTDAARAFWDPREELIRGGMPSVGRLERAFARIRGGFRWRAGLAALGAAPGLAGLGRGRGDLAGMFARVAPDGPFVRFLRDGAVDALAGLHPWLTVEKLGPVAVEITDAPRGRFDAVSFGDAHEHFTVPGGFDLAPGAPVVAWERFHPVVLPSAFRDQPAGDWFSRDRSPLHTRLRVWRYEP